MRKGIHPDYVESTVTCSCGAAFKTRSTKPDLHLELCSQCHPFYTGKQKYVDTGGRVQRFSDKFGNAATSVIDRESAARNARQKAHEEATLASREAKASRDADRVSRASKYEVADAREQASATGEVAEVMAETEAPEAEAVTETGAPEVAEEAPAEEPESAE